MGVLHGNRDRVEPPGPNLVKSRDPLADPIEINIQACINNGKNKEKAFSIMSNL